MSSLLDDPQLTVPIGERDHVLGPPAAPVTLLDGLIHTNAALTPRGRRALSRRA